MSERRQFAGFPRDYSLAPLWSWNDDLREDEIVRQLDEMCAQHVNEAMIFPMVGLVQPYLSPEYFDAYRFTLAAAKKRGMRIWVYDDYCWPSGTAAGQLLEQYPEYRMPTCRFYRYQIQARDARDFRVALPPGRIIHAWSEKSGVPGKYRPIMDAVLDTVLDWRAPSGAWTINLAVVTQVQVTLETATGSRWSRNTFGYLDVLNPAAVQKYIEMVYESHYHAAPKFFGATMPGFFTDEPGFLYDMQIEGGRDKIRPGYHGRPGKVDATPFADNPALHGYHRSIPWTHDLLAQFHARYGYDLRSRLPALVRGSSAGRKVSHDFFKLASDLFAANYSRQIGDWCGRRKVAFSGHWCEGFGMGDLYRKAKPQHVPGIDILGGHSVFSKLIMLPRQIASIARMTGRRRVLAETYGVTPWNFELADKIRDADLLTVLGINLHAPIDYAYSFRGIRKHTNNPPGFYHTPGWRHQKHFSDHTARLCLATSIGSAAVSTAILYPSHADLANTLADSDANDVLEQYMRGTFTTLLAAQVETDFLFESGLPEARIKKGEMVFPGAAYRTIIIAGVNVLAQTTFSMLAEFVKAGGRLVLFDCRPAKDAYGRPAPAGWRELLRRAVKPDRDGCIPAPTADRDEGVPAPSGICVGQVVLASDPLGMVTHSAVLANGDKEYLFDGTDSLAVFGAKYPQEITVDLGATLPLAELGFVVEKIKKDIVYNYSWQVSDDGRQWREVAHLKQAGRNHSLPLIQHHAAKMSAPGAGTPSSRPVARHVRLQVVEGGGRFLGLHAIAIKYLDDTTGVVKNWHPPVTGVSFWRGLAGADNPAPLRFFTNNGDLCDCLAVTTRTVGRDRIIAVMNRSNRDLRLTAMPAKDFSGCIVENWDLDTGAILPVQMETRRLRPSLKIDFAPYECRVLALTGAKSRSKSTPVSLVRAYEPIIESNGPWQFRTERQNAFPLLAGTVRFADPAHPAKWLPAENGGLPKPLRLVPRVMFECVFGVAQLPAGAVDLLYEEDMLADICVNGRAITTRPTRNRYLDAFGRSVPVIGCLRKGKNRIAGLYMPEIYERTMGGIFYHADVIQPTLDAFLLGDFAVVNDRIARPIRRLDGRTWQVQGYPYYAGTGIYEVEFRRPKHVPTGMLHLEAAARNAVVEVCDMRGRPLGVRVAPPYLFKVPGSACGGVVAFKLKVTSTLGALLAHQRLGALTGNYVKQYATGLESVRLVGYE